MSYFQMGSQSAPAFGPLLGGVLSDRMGWHFSKSAGTLCYPISDVRAVFWFLVIIATPALLVIIVFLPETLRTIAGNGSVSLMYIAWRTCLKWQPGGIERHSQTSDRSR